MTPAPSDISLRKYAVFISYRHADNKEPGRQWATWLHQALEGYEVPSDLIGVTNSRGEAVPHTLFPVFRDEEELPADADLTRNIRHALENSLWLVVLCSPRAAKSRFVADEIRYFKELGKSDRIIALIVDGEPNASDDAGKRQDGISPEMECFPEPLRFGVSDASGKIDWSERAEPIAADVRPDGLPQQGWTNGAAFREHLGIGPGAARGAALDRKVSEYEKRLELAKLKVVAGALGLPLGTLTQRDKVMQLAKAREKARVLRRWLAVTVLLGLLAVGGGVYAFWQRDAAIKNFDLAKQNETKATASAKEAETNAATARANAKLAQDSATEAKRALSKSDYLRANTLVRDDNRNTALAYLARAIRVDPANLAAGQRALLLLQQGLWYIPEATPKLPDGFAIGASYFAPGGEPRYVGLKFLQGEAATSTLFSVFERKAAVLSREIG
jgi:hypothetical protein